MGGHAHGTEVAGGRVERSWTNVSGPGVRRGDAQLRCLAEGLRGFFTKAAVPSVKILLPVLASSVVGWGWRQR